MQTSCTLQKHSITIEGRDWRNRERLVLGCVPKQQHPPPQMAPTDLRGMTLPPSWNTMRVFSLTPGNTEYIPNLPNTLRSLDIEKNRIRELPILPDTVENVIVNNNQIPSFKNLPKSCRRLEAKHNLLESLPEPIPATLQFMYITHNYIEKLPDFSKTRLERVGLGFNLLRTLPKFPDTLEVLGCGNNDLKEISNLPQPLRVLVCANNRNLTSLRIENLRNLQLLIANNCGLRKIPLLPNTSGQDDDDNNDNNDNNNDNNNGNNDNTRYMFDGNPLDPGFQQVYNDYLDHENPNRFRRAVLREHRRIIAEQKASLGAMEEVFKPSYSIVKAKEGKESEEEARQRTMREQIFFGGPGNLIASFITGKKGALETQKLGLGENQEALRAIPKGTTATERERYANIVVQMDERLKDVEGELSEKQKALLKNRMDRAKYYVDAENIKKARERYQVKIKKILEQQKINAKKAELIRALTDVQGRIAVDIERYRELAMKYLDTHRKDLKHLNKILPDYSGSLEIFLQKLYDSEGCPPGFKNIILKSLTNKSIREYSNFLIKEYVLKVLLDKIQKLLQAIQDNPQHMDYFRSSNKELFENPDAYYAKVLDTIESIANKLFPEFRDKGVIDKIKRDIDAFCKEIDNLFNPLLISSNIPNKAIINPEDDAYIIEDRGDFEGEEERQAMEELRNAQAEFATVVNNDEENGEALRVAMLRAIEDQEFDDEEEEQGAAGAGADDIPVQGGPVAILGEDGVIRNQQGRVIAEDEGQQALGRLLAGQARPGDRELLERQEDEARRAREELEERRERSRERMRERMRERLQVLQERHGPEFLERRLRPREDEENKVPENNEDENDNSEESEENERARALEEEMGELQREQLMIQREPGDNPDANARRLAEIARRIDEIEREFDQLNNAPSVNSEEECLQRQMEVVAPIFPIFQRLGIKAEDYKYFFDFLNEARPIYEPRGFTLEELVRLGIPHVEERKRREQMPNKGGRRQRRTPRKQKSVRQTRRH